ncbi:hypothetical protein, partial [Salmonella sp. s55044]|uniref:hypothetical protein n=1 Tax=Salmonella sp. s55044 TaxID=3159677 RepID=UPI00397EA2EE
IEPGQPVCGILFASPTNENVAVIGDKAPDTYPCMIPGREVSRLWIVVKGLPQFCQLKAIFVAKV